MKKSKRMTAVILSALMAVSAFTALPVSAATADNQTAAVSDSLVSGDFKYSVLDDGSVEISKYNGNDAEVVIPDTINGKTVTSIGDYAFEWCTSLTSITIPDSVTSIGDWAFYNCTGLTSITVDDNNTKYSSSDGVLYDKNKNTLILYPGGKVGDYIIPDSVTSIGNHAFFDCIGLTSLTISEKITSIKYDDFLGCTSLTSVTVDDKNAKYSSSDGVLFDKNKDTLILCPEGKVGDYIIPDSVTNIGDHAFSYCTGLASITIPDSVTSIGNYAFYNCTGLASITIPDSVTSIGESAFTQCTSLTSITISESVTIIEDFTFWSCTSLTSITIPDSVTSIGFNAFDDCASIKSITIPGSVTSIGYSAFGGCTSLTSITVDDNNNNYSSTDGVLFDKNKDTLIKCPAGKVGDYIIPDSVTSIADGAFSDCTRLTSIIISDSVTSIGSGAFCNCTGLKSITIPNSVNSIGIYAFRSCTSLMSITVDNNNVNYSSFEGVLFDKNKDTLILCPNGKVGDYIIPDSVTIIVDAAFSDCTRLTSITIPNSVTSIGSSAFLDCTSLTSITIPNSVISILYRAFGYYYDKCNNTYVKMNNLTIKGYRGTAAETYANQNGFEFVLIDNKNFIDDTSGVEVSGVMLDDAVLSVTELENTFENAVATYDITLQSNGTAVQPDGTLTVKIPSDAENCKVMWLKDDGSAENMNAEYTDGCYVFTTNHLSVYALVENNEILTGDSNGDGIVNVNDVTYLQLHISGNVNDDGSPFINTENKAIFDSVDMNKDGKLDVQDVTALQIHIAGNQNA